MATKNEVTHSVQSMDNLAGPIDTRAVQKWPIKSRPSIRDPNNNIHVWDPNGLRSKLKQSAACYDSGMTGHTPVRDGDRYLTAGWLAKRQWNDLQHRHSSVIPLLYTQGREETLRRLTDWTLSALGRVIAALWDIISGYPRNPPHKTKSTDFT